MDTAYWNAKKLGSCTCRPSISMSSCARTRLPTPSLVSSPSERVPAKPSSSSKKMIAGAETRALKNRINQATASALFKQLPQVLLPS